MTRTWNMHTVFALLITGFWQVAAEHDLDAEELFTSMERRLRANLIASQLL